MEVKQNYYTVQNQLLNR